MWHLPPDRPGRARPPHAVHFEQLGNILGAPAADPGEQIAAIALGRHHHSAADEYLAGLGHRLKPGRDVDPIAIDIAIVLDDIAEVDADAQLERPVVKALLDGKRRINGLVDAREHRKEAVTRRFEGASAMAGDGGVDQIVKDSAQLCIGRRLVLGHQPAVADDVSGHDCRELALHFSLPTEWPWHRAGTADT